MNYLKSKDFKIHILCYWWIFWISISFTSINQFKQMSGDVLIQYILLLTAFGGGYLLLRPHHKIPAHGKSAKSIDQGINAPKAKKILRIASILIFLFLLFSLKLSGAFEQSFAEYFAKLRIGEGNSTSLTGISILDVLTKIFAFPAAYIIILISLSNKKSGHHLSLTVSLLSVLLYCYLWQVNYPFIHLFWIYIFSFIYASKRGEPQPKGGLFLIAILIAILTASAANRIGGDIAEGIQRYVVGYHLIGFSFYDLQFHDPNSILHSTTFGQSSLGIIDTFFEILTRPFQLGHIAASSENAIHNNETLDIGVSEIWEVNAFGTLLFTLYRDFKYLGIAIGGFAFGAVITHLMFFENGRWLHRALLIFLSTTWMIGMMVSPIEQGYFWIVIFALLSANLLQRGVRL
jgi:oligosaccharide repeat unit polymerase